MEGKQMDCKRFTIGTIVGAVTLYIIGYVIFDLAFGPFFEANKGSATGVDRSTTLQWAFVLANLAYAALIVYAMGNRAGSLSIVRGAKIGAIVGFFYGFSVDFVQYAFMNLSNLTATIVDSFLMLVHGAIAGIVIAAVLKKVPASAPKPV
jgi:hypothetical protein